MLVCVQVCAILPFCRIECLGILVISGRDAALPTHDDAHSGRPKPGASRTVRRYAAPRRGYALCDEHSGHRSCCGTTTDADGER